MFTCFLQKGEINETNGKSIKLLMLGILIPLILLGQIAASVCANKNITDYGDSVINKDLSNGYLAAQ